MGLPLLLPLLTASPQAAAGANNIFRKFQRDGVWEAIWAELHMVLRERMSREASPSAAVLDSQSIKSAEKGAVTSWPSGGSPGCGLRSAIHRDEGRQIGL
jgi:putative transposase